MRPTADISTCWPCWVPAPCISVAYVRCRTPPPPLSPSSPRVPRPVRHSRGQVFLRAIRGRLLLPQAAPASWAAGLPSPVCSFAARQPCFGFQGCRPWTALSACLTRSSHAQRLLQIGPRGRIADTIPSYPGGFAGLLPFATSTRHPIIASWLACINIMSMLVTRGWFATPLVRSFLETCPTSESMPSGVCITALPPQSPRPCSIVASSLRAWFCFFRYPWSCFSQTPL